MSARDGLFAKFERLDDLLVAKGFPPTSEFWRATLGRFLGSNRRTLVARVGRRGGKSSTLCRLAVALALFGDHEIPPGDVGVIAFVSARKDEAAARLHTIEAILRALHVPFRRIGETIDLEGRPAHEPIRFAVFPCTVAGVSGFTSIAVICDEVSKWRDAESGSNPATEVIAALKPTMATQPSARMVLSSSPLGTSDAHAEAFDRGDTPDQLTAHAPTWIANPTISEAQTHALESDDRVWRREYEAIPQAGALGAFDEEAIDRAFRPIEVAARGGRVMVLDPSSGRKDRWTYARAGYDVADGRSILNFDSIEGFDGGFWKQLSGEEIVSRVAEMAHAFTIRTLIGDQRESLMLVSAFARHGLQYIAIDWTQPRKITAVARLRRLFAEGAIILPDHDGLRRELRQFEERISPNGSFTYGARGNGHDDYVALLITAAMADEDRILPGSPVAAAPSFSMSTEMRAAMPKALTLPGAAGRVYGASAARLPSSFRTDQPRRWGDR